MLIRSIKNILGILEEKCDPITEYSTIKLKWQMVKQKQLKSVF